jgi:hypothetical protein
MVIASAHENIFFLKSQRHEYAGHVLIEKKPLQIKGKEKKTKTTSRRRQQQHHCRKKHKAPNPRKQRLASDTLHAKVHMKTLDAMVLSSIGNHLSLKHEL